MKNIIKILFFLLFIQACSDSTLEKKGFQVREIIEGEQGQKIVGLPIDSLKLETRPRNVLLTKDRAHRLVPIYKVNYDKKTKKPFVGDNDFHRDWDPIYAEGNNWNGNFMPGFSAVHGYNFVNVAHYDNERKAQTMFFERPVLIKTLYYPAFSSDTLNHRAVARDYYMVSAYDEDSNKDGFINSTDLRRFYLFDLNGKPQKPLVPKNYSVLSSEYDPDNDFMYVFAKLDQNENGQMELEEPTHIFWVDLKNPENTGLQYKND
jgi:hypothetical protein